MWEEQVAEDIKLVSHIKDVFSLLQSSLSAFLPDSKLADFSPQVGNILNRVSCFCVLKSYSVNSWQLMSLSFKTQSEVSNNCPHGFDQEVSNTWTTHQPHLLPSAGKYTDFYSNVLPCPGFHQSEIFQTAAELPVFLGETSEFRYSEKDAVRPGSGNPISDIQKKMQLKLFNYQNVNLNRVGKLVGACKVDHFCLPLVFDHSDQDESDRFVYHQGVGQHLPEPLEMKLRNDSEGRLKCQGHRSCVNNVNPPLKFSAGCELHEALGSCFKEEKDICVWGDTGSAEIEGLAEAPDEVLRSLCGGSEGSEQLLEAVVANAYSGTGNITIEDSLCKSAHSGLTTESVKPTLKHIKHGSIAMDQIQHNCSLGGSKELCTVRSPNVTSSKTQGSCSELSEMYVGPSKMSKKRARPGENFRPRPRDRQLIQDRIKELRDIVPNGSKVTIRC